MEGIFSNGEIAIEILSWLPIESLNDLKSVCKQWRELLSHPSFCSAHFRRSAKTNSGIFLQSGHYCKYCQNNLDVITNGYISIGKEGRYATSENILDFLPEKVVVLASCSGLLLCRNILDIWYSDHCYHRNMLDYYPKEVVLYVCNPFTTEWATLKPRGKYENGCCYGFAYEPFGAAVAPNFVVVMVQPPLQLGKDPYLIQIYCSKRGTWRAAKEVCTLSDRLVIRQGYFTKGVFYWLTSGHSILAFDLKREKCQVIKLPDNVMDDEEILGLCLGVSEGSLHYIRCNRVELTVWVLKNNNLLRAQQWVLKHSKPQLEMHHEFLGIMDSRRFPHDHELPNSYIDPYAFQDDIVFMRVQWNICTYNIKKGEFEDDLCSLQKFHASSYSWQSSASFPYCKSILRVQAKD